MEIKKIEAKEFGLEQKQVTDVDLAFAAKQEEIKIINDVYAEIIKKDINKEVANEARKLRLRAVEVKTGIAKIHKSQKAFALAFGRYCDAWKNKETEPIQQIIDNLVQIEKFEEIQEKKRLEKLQNERAEMLSPYAEDAHDRTLSGMDEDVWQAYFALKKKEHEDRIEAEKKAEQERIEKERKDKLRTERREQALPYLEFWTDKEKGIDFAEISAYDFDNFIQRIKEEKEGKDEKSKKDLERIKSLQGLTAFLPEHLKNGEYLNISDIEFNDILEDARQEKLYFDLEQERLEDERLLKDEIRKQRESDLKPYIQFIRDYSKMLDMGQEEYEKEFSEIQRAAMNFKVAEEKRKEQEREQLAEKIRLEEEEKERQAELAMGDAEKVNSLISELESLAQKYAFESDKNKKMYADVQKLIVKVVDHIKKIAG